MLEKKIITDRVSIDTTRGITFEELTLKYNKEVEKLQKTYENVHDIGLYGIVETEEGDALFKIDWGYSGEPCLMEKYMHLKSFIGFYGSRNMRFLDHQSEQYIKSYIQSIEHGK